MNGQFAPGDVLPPFVVDPVPAWPMRVVAGLMSDPNPIHLDAGAVGDLGLGDRRINQGPLDIAYVFNMLLAAAGGPERVLWLSARLDGHVFEGDRVVAGGRVTGVRQTPAGALVECEIWLAREPGGRVVEGTAAFLEPSDREERAG